MPSSFSSFDVLVDNDDGTTTPVAGATVLVYDLTNDAALPDLVADGDGHVASVSLDVDAGTDVRFTVIQTNGLAGYADQITT